MSVKKLLSNRVKRPSWQQLLGGLVVTVSIVVLVGILILNWSELTSYRFDVDIVFVLLAFLTYSAALWIAVIGWVAILRRMIPNYQGNNNIAKHLQYYVHSRLLQRLPIPLLHMVGRSKMYESEGIAGKLTLTIGIIEWILLLLSGLVVSMLLLPFIDLPLPAVLKNPWLRGMLIVAGILLLHPRVVRLVVKALKQDSEADSLSYTMILISVLIYGMVWLLGGLVLFLVIQSLQPVTINRLPMVIGMWTISGVFTTALFAIIPGFGTHELTLALLLGYIMWQPLPVIVMLLMRLYLLIFDILWAAIANLALLPLLRRITQKDY